LLGVNGLGPEYDLWLETSGLMYAALAAGMAVAVMPLPSRAALARGWLPTGAVALRLALMPLFVVATLKLTAASYSPFLYFQF
jgi:alginate O-acetyltransferase complex protein AlgI